MTNRSRKGPEGDAARAADLYDVDLLYAVARMYYEEGLGQSTIAEQLRVSRPTVSRMLSHARETGMVQIKVIHPRAGGSSELAEQLRLTLGLDAVYLADGMQSSRMGPGMQPAVLRAVEDMQLSQGDALVVSSGMAVYGVAHMELPPLDGVALAPAVGGVAEPEAWHQTNEIVRTMALRTGSTYVPIFAGAIPSPLMYEAVQADEAFSEVRKVWKRAKGSIMGIGSPTTGRTSLASAIPQDSLAASIGDVCLHFYDRSGAELGFPGSERTVRIPREDLASIPFSTAIAVGEEKVWSILTASSMGMFRRLVTDEATARLMLAARAEAG
ncbi:helix-turn-helix domain-containing protein [Rothia sp. AR01]|uniref:Helix-turn-helix domain-containing protein n=1 Tax=Rothia santali TaxID=2949643 RepID=A0A9X2HA03_9MICC|nr:sugar-binding domain-containing protein [Rothia santali]MCP3425421.1 helix-turn-helix domain-containing protein [Rothia santali]